MSLTVSQSISDTDVLILQNDLRDIDPRQPKKIHDPFDKKPENWDDRQLIVTIDENTGEK